MKRCCICSREIQREDAPILTLGGAGYERLLCDECDGQLQTATLGRDLDEIKYSINEISTKMASGSPDNVTFKTVSQLMTDAAKRANAIKDGTYDFALDEEESDEGFDEIPEELLESEEDVEKDKADEEKMKKFDKVYNILLIAACVIFAGFLIWKLIENFLLK